MEKGHACFLADTSLPAPAIPWGLGRDSLPRARAQGWLLRKLQRSARMSKRGFDELTARQMSSRDPAPSPRAG